MIAPIFEKTVRRILEDDEDVVLATIISNSGSTPRIAGTKMLIRQDGRIHGTVGGGLLEARVIKKAEDVFGTGRASLLYFDLTLPYTADSMDMICGGSAHVLLELLKADPSTIEMFRNLSERLNNGKPCLFVAEISNLDETIDRIDRCICMGSENSYGTLALPEHLVEQMESVTRANRSPMLVELGSRKFLLEPLFIPETVYLFGAGHVSREVAVMAQRVHFRVVVLDDRKQYANSERFGTADEIVVLQNFETVFAELPIGPDAYIVIVTRGHVHDKTVLAQALETDACYIGMIGSRRKRDQIYRALKTQGVTDQDLKRVHSPIGLKIGAQTPEEIAVSITAELISHRASAKKQTETPILR